ncbi:MAG: excisionase family DNA-binding protein [Deltaproteobacteria bacterium]|nr:excisionase family DNA-binding protein [Deltaproteobacteria bacterium]
MPKKSERAGKESQKQPEWGRYISRKQLANYLGVSLRTVDTHWPEWVSDYNVRAYRIGRRILFNREDIDSMMEKHLLIGGGL